MSVDISTEKHTTIIEESSAPELDYHVIASGSSGNAVRIKNIMVDCGIPFKRMREDLYQCDTLLITHSHNDHLKVDTLESIRKEFPRIKVYANADVAYRVEVDKVIGSAPFELKNGRRIIPFDGKHDVPVTCFIIQMDDMNILYATDTSEIKPPVDMLLDYVFLESNYDERKLNAVGGQYVAKGYNPYDANLRHLSTQKCKEFYFLNRRTNKSPLVELHMSSRFY